MSTPDESDASPSREGEATSDIDCAICLQKCNHPARLPCGHVFCFLCVKGISSQNRRCAMCRQIIPPDFVERPDLVSVPTPVPEVAFEGGYQWFYEGRNGWWQYDERTSAELEAASKRAARRCEVLIAGFIYTIDFDQMVQMRRDHPSRRRRIKRDLVTIAKKGIAGIRTEATQQTENCVAPAAESNPAAVPCRENGGSVALGDHSYVACGRDSADEPPPVVEAPVVVYAQIDLTGDDEDAIEVLNEVLRPPSSRRRRPPRRWYYEDFL